MRPSISAAGTDSDRRADGHAITRHSGGYARGAKEAAATR